jgi:hypothetical protein
MTAVGSYRFQVTGRSGAIAAYLLNEAASGVRCGLSTTGFVSLS